MTLTLKKTMNAQRNLHPPHGEEEKSNGSYLLLLLLAFRD